MTQISLALRYASHGWPVFQLHSMKRGVCSCLKGRACGRPGEHPRRRRWGRDATTDRAEIRELWRQRPDANIGIVTGPASGIIAIICDPAHGGNETFQRLQTNLGPLVIAIAWFRGAGGWVAIFKHPAFRIRADKLDLGPGLTVVAAGGYVAAPRSRDASGIRCTWFQRASDKANDPCPLPPQWLARVKALAGDGGRGQLVLDTVINVAPKSVEWLWPGRIALGKLCDIAGDAGLAKSQLSIFLAATVSTGGNWPSGEGSAPRGSVLMLCAEDDVADTVRPRLEVAGADLSRVHIISGVEYGGRGSRPFDLLADLQWLEQEISQLGDVRLVVIDPITAFLGRGADARIALTRLQNLAAKFGFAVVVITHLTKATGLKALSRVMGATAFVAVARSVFIVAQEKGTDRRLFLPAKNNLASVRTGLAYRTEIKTTSTGITSPALIWDSEPITVSVDEALAAVSSARKPQPALTDAEDFLRLLLGEGPIPVKEIFREANDAGVSRASLRRAADALDVRTRRLGGIAGSGYWIWELPERSAPDGGQTGTLTDARSVPFSAK